MTSYTVDSVTLLHYLLDALPGRTQEIVERAEDGDARLELPPIVLAETSYILNKRDEIRAKSVRSISDPDDVRTVLTTIKRGSPIEVVQTGFDELRVVVERMEEFSIHDAIIVASHVSRDTDAILTKDRTITDSDIRTIWR